MTITSWPNHRKLVHIPRIAIVKHPRTHYLSRVVLTLTRSSIHACAEPRKRISN